MHHFTITFSGNNREFKFKAANEAEADQWINAINAHIQISQGLKNRALAPVTAEFWKQEQISEE